jgi:hypothetical protein
MTRPTPSPAAAGHFPTQLGELAFQLVRLLAEDRSDIVSKLEKGIN